MDNQNTAGVDLDKLRVEFEREALRLSIVDDEGLERNESGDYIDEPAQAAWEAWQAARRTAPVSAPMGQELPVPDDWKARMVKYGETENVAIRKEIAELRAAITQRDERIRQLERELAERKTANIDTPEFRELLGRVQGWRDGKPIMSPDSPVGRASQQLIAYIDGRTAGTAPDDLLEIGNRMATTLEVLAAALKNPDTAEGVRCTVEEWHAAAPTPMNSGKEEG